MAVVGDDEHVSVGKLALGAQSVEPGPKPLPSAVARLDEHNDITAEVDGEERRGRDPRLGLRTQRIAQTIKVEAQSQANGAVVWEEQPDEEEDEGNRDGEVSRIAPPRRRQ